MSKDKDSRDPIVDPRPVAPLGALARPVGVPAATPTATDEAASSAFSSLAGEVAKELNTEITGSYDGLSPSGKDALRAFASSTPDKPTHESARRAALDAIRDHQRGGTWNPVARSKAPEDRNQRPTGTVGEDSGTPGR